MKGFWNTKKDLLLKISNIEETPIYVYDEETIIKKVIINKIKIV
jgi:hypothetical protein